MGSFYWFKRQMNHYFGICRPPFWILRPLSRAISLLRPFLTNYESRFEKEYSPPLPSKRFSSVISNAASHATDSPASAALRMGKRSWWCSPAASGGHFYHAKSSEEWGDFDGWTLTYLTCQKNELLVLNFFKKKNLKLRRELRFSLF